MAYYYINSNAQQDSGEHEVHTTGCDHPPKEENRIGLGYFNNCQEAVAAAKAAWPYWSINGCYYCSNPCNTG